MAEDPEVSCIYTDQAPRPFGDAYCQAVAAGGFVFVSGQGGFLRDGTLVPGGAAAEARQALLNIQAILAAVRVPLKNVVRTTIYTATCGTRPPSTRSTKTCSRGR
jgi:2-iminobutanoate/2-iminopropanoate deaminase